jgi:glycerol kinase
MRAVSVLVIDLGTTTIRSSILDEVGNVTASRSRHFPPHRPRPGVAEFDPNDLARSVLELSREVLQHSGGVRAVGIATQRASTVLFDPASGKAVGPGLGWQDQRTVGRCIALQQQGVRLSPNQSATKLAYLLEQFGGDAPSQLRFATLDTWIAWTLSEGACHVTDATNAAVTGLVDDNATGWDLERCAILGVDPELLASIVDSSGIVGTATALPGAPPITALIGDQQASLIGQGCLSPGTAKVTFGTGGMLDACIGDERPTFATRGEQGTFPIVTRQLNNHRSWGVEAILLSAGSCIEWLRDGLGIIEQAADTDAIAAGVRDAGGVSFVPAFGGYGTPLWDFGARGTLTGLDGATTKAEVLRAVLEGIANAGADLLLAVESDTGLCIPELRVDGGMAANSTFLQLLANATGRPIAKSSLLEATTRGAGFLAGLAVDMWASLESTAALVAPAEIIQPVRRADRERWLDARERAGRVVPFLSALEF